MCMHADHAGRQQQQQRARTARSQLGFLLPWPCPCPPCLAAAGPRGAGPWLDSAEASPPPCPAKGALLLAGHEHRAPRAGPAGGIVRCTGLPAYVTVPCRKRSARLGWPVRDEMSSECAWFSAVPPVLARARCRAPAGRAACAGGGCSFVCARASPRPRLHARRCAIVRASRCRRQRINLGVGGGGHGLG